MAGKLVFESPPLTLRAGASATASRSDALALKLALAKPFPVVVGCPRSGTSLLAVMLDSHSQLAVPPETSFLAIVAGLRTDSTNLRQRVFEIMTADRITISNWSDFGLNKDELWRRLVSIEPFTATAGVRAFYALYAESQRKARAGEKTPGYIFAMPQIAALLPEAHFIHVIRDPRDTALSWRKTWFAPSQDFGILGQAWRLHVEAGQRGGAMLRHYLELRYEDLVLGAGAVLRRVCDFLSLPFEAAMLDYAARGEARLARLQGRQHRDGRMISRDERTRIHANLTRSPAADRIDVWRREMNDAERRQVEAGAGPLLNELGYTA